MRCWQQQAAEAVVGEAEGMEPGQGQAGDAGHLYQGQEHTRINTCTHASTLHKRQEHTLQLGAENDGGCCFVGMAEGTELGQRQPV